MLPLWITLIVSIVVNDCINAAVVVRRRPITIQERVPFTTTKATTTTTTTAEPFESEEVSTVVNRLSRLTLPSNATSIRSDITDNFSCRGRSYGYYADVENDCQIFHVCLPVTYPDGQERQFRWSFICPEETTFNQEAFTCVRTDEMNFDCTDSERFYELNRILGLKEETTTDEVTTNELTPIENNKSSSGDRLNTFQNKEQNQRFTVPLINNPNRYAAQTAIRNQIARRTTASPYSSAANMERIAQTTNFREFSIDRSEPSTTVNEFIPSTTFSPVNIAQFFDLTTRKAFNLPTTTTTTTTINDNSEYTTDYTVTGSVNEYTTNKYDSNTRIIPDLIEDGSKNADLVGADEVVDSIKQLQKLFPSTGDDSREKRLLVKTDSIKNRQKLFEILNKH
ncbi:uncharacterized protein LOC129579221 [Sitodiplosis mosellana]|uniref:uncharacterized protein LOC129579221 n=1 Tax=Sitodiplosis mosellana TaxID=263140 RepID=UPI0024445DA4|nr:uncharacterized protein LOC129579221 [Sitodiplosis mosellana]